MKKYLFNKVAVVTWVAVSFSQFALAATAPNITLTDTKIVEIMCKAMNWMFGILIVLSVIMVLVAAYMYVTSSGDAEKVSKATKTITYAAIGVVAALLARGVPILVASILGAKDISACGGGGGGSGSGGSYY